MSSSSIFMRMQQKRPSEDSRRAQCAPAALLACLFLGGKVFPDQSL